MRRPPSRTPATLGRSRTAWLIRHWTGDTFQAASLYASLADGHGRWRR